MFVGRVDGNIVSTVKHYSLKGKKLLIVQPLDRNGIATVKPKICVDLIGAGYGDFVLVNDEGSSARLVLERNDTPVRTIITGFVDEVNVNLFGGGNADR